MARRSLPIMPPRSTPTSSRRSWLTAPPSRRRPTRPRCFARYPLTTASRGRRWPRWWASPPLPSAMWRRNGAVTAENRRRLAGVLAFCDFLEQLSPMISDPALWFDTPVLTETTLTHSDLYSRGLHAELLDIASQRSDPDGRARRRRAGLAHAVRPGPQLRGGQRRRRDPVDRPQQHRGVVSVHDIGEQPQAMATGRGTGRPLACWRRPPVARAACRWPLHGGRPPWTAG